MLTDEKLKNGVKGMINDPKFDLASGFKFAYTSLIKAMADKDYNFIEQMCEHNLSESLFNAVNEIDHNGYKLECLNPVKCWPT